MLAGIPVSPGFIDRASQRLALRLGDAGFDEAMQAALAAEPALGADETPVNVLTPDADPGTGQPEAGSPHILVIRSPGEADLATGAGLAAPRRDHRDLVVLHRVPHHRRVRRLPGSPAPARRIQQCCQHVIRRCRAVAKLGPGSLQSWGADVIEILREAHGLVEEARAGTVPRTRSCWPSSASATTRPSPSGSSTTGTGTGTTATTPATSWAAGCATTPGRSGCAPANPPWSGRTRSPSRVLRPPSGTRPSPATGTPRQPSPAGAASAATSTPPPLP